MTAIRQTANTRAIRSAVVSLRGGFENASDEQIQELWGAMTLEDQKAALAKTATKESNDDRAGQRKKG